MKQTNDTPVFFWFRRDLRLSDNAGLYHALRSGNPVIPVFIFDTEILSQLTDKQDARVHFIHNSIVDLQNHLLLHGSSLVVKIGSPALVWKQLITEYSPLAVYANEDYEPYATQRDNQISTILSSNKINFHLFKDQVIFSKNEVVKPEGTPYTVFTPYSKKWLEKLNPYYLKPYPTEKYTDTFYKTDPLPIPTLEEIGFVPSAIIFPKSKITDTLIQQYTENRNYPAISGTSKISVHLRFGTISIRYVAMKAKSLNNTWLNELIWRDFYMMILWQFPYVEKQSFKKEYDRIAWRNNETEFKAWCEGNTGYPMVDAGMRELNKTGFMHNRVRMVTASFLSKHLLIDWRWGEAYFAQKLLDYDLAANNGGWQWAAGTGVDAAPYFRIFNPYLQTKRFDSDLAYINKWVPEHDKAEYPAPIVDHEYARNRCLATYQKALNS